MAVTSGFFNSINGDRKYDALQMAELFDGLINDGVYETLYNRFQVSAHENFIIKVDTGRGWFAHTWIKNDGLLLLALDEPDILNDRIDAVVIEVNHSDAIRLDSIKIVKGTPSASPVRPTLSKGDNDIWQYPLAYVSVKTTATAITASDITNMIGTSECPFVTGIISVMDIDMLIEQWQSQWKDRLGEHENEWNDHIGQHESEWNDWYENHTNQYQYDFKSWFQQLQTLLERNEAANLLNEILKLKDKWKLLAREHIITDTIDDNTCEPILDNFGREIEGTFYFTDDVTVILDNCECEAGGSGGFLDATPITTREIDAIFR